MSPSNNSSFGVTRDTINQTSVELLLTDSRVALTFISIAETTEKQETAERNIHNARKAYDSIQTLRLRYVFTKSQTDELDTNLSQVQARLKALGQTF